MSSSEDTRHPRGARRPRPAADAGLPALMAELVEPLAREAVDPLRRIRLAWGRICGMPLARHIEPLRLEGRTLHVGARGPVWRDAVFHQRAALLGHVRRYAPTVERIWLHSLPEQAVLSVSPSPAPALTDQTAGISNTALRRALEGLLHARGRTDRADD